MATATAFNVKDFGKSSNPHKNQNRKTKYSEINTHLHFSSNLPVSNKNQKIEINVGKTDGKPHQKSKYGFDQISNLSNIKN